MYLKECKIFSHGKYLILPNLFHLKYFLWVLLFNVFFWDGGGIVYSSGKEHNFNKKATLNQGTSYDYNSVMQYHKSVNHQKPYSLLNWVEMTANMKYRLCFLVFQNCFL